MTRVWFLILLFFPVVAWANTPAKIIKVYSTYMGGFVGLRDDGSITTWGDSTYGGSLPQSVSTQLTGHRVEEIFSGNCAFAALTDGGMVVTWGGGQCGGDSSAVAQKLASGVDSVYATTTDGFSTKYGAFAALKTDGSVVTWGDASSGGDSSGVASRLTSGVSKVVANLYNFAALKDDGSVVTWGEEGFDNFLAPSPRYGFSRDPYLLLQSGVSDIFAGGSTFVALKSDGQLIGWGNRVEADTLELPRNTQITGIYSSQHAYAALKSDGSVLVWGNPAYGGNASAIQNQLVNVSEMVANRGGFAALKKDGTVVTWEGRFDDIPSDGEAWEHSKHPDGGRKKVNLVDLNTQGVRVTKIFAGEWAFVALKDNGTIVTWGYREAGADTVAARAAIGSDSVSEIVPSRGAFAVLKSNGSVATWGDSEYGGDSSSVSSQLGSGIIQVVGSQGTFSALKGDGSIVTW